MKKHSIFTRLRHTFIVVVLGFLLPTTGVAFAADSPAWDKTFPQSDHRWASVRWRKGTDIGLVCPADGGTGIYNISFRRLLQCRKRPRNPRNTIAVVDRYDPTTAAR